MRPAVAPVDAEVVDVAHVYVAAPFARVDAVDRAVVIVPFASAAADTEPVAGRGG